MSDQEIYNGDDSERVLRDDDDANSDVVVVRMQESSPRLSPSSSSHYDDAQEDIDNSTDSQDHFEESHEQHLNGDESAGEEEIETEIPAREHSYLPGASHPLFPEELLDRRRRMRSGSLSNNRHPAVGAEVENINKRTKSNNSIREHQDRIFGIKDDDHNEDTDSNMLNMDNKHKINEDIYERACGKSESSMHMELPILELNGVVLFPGSTIPIRLRNPHWIDYLGRQIDRARQLVSNDEVRMGILTHADLPLRRHTQEHEQNQNVQDSTSWMRRGSNLRILTRNNSDFLNQYERFLEEFAREELARAITGNDIDDTEDSSDDDDDSPAALPEAPARGERNRNIAAAGALHRMTASATNSERSFAQRGQERQSLRTSTSRQRNQTPSDPLIGRIGTMATITYTHEDAAVATGGRNSAIDADDPQQYSRVWQRSESSQIVVTALGTGRFKIISRIDGDNGSEGIAISRRRHREWGEHADIRLYKVKPLLDEEIPMPPVALRKRIFSDSISRGLPGEADNSDEESSPSSIPYMNFHDQLLRNLSNVSHVPTMTYKKYWPWSLVGKIRSALDRVPGFDGLRKTLPPLPGSLIANVNETDDHDYKALKAKSTKTTSSSSSCALLQPMRFSFWLASNMALSEKDKLDLLQMNCTVQRLRFIHKKVLEQVQNETFVCCKMCGRQLSQVSNIFTVEGSEGTTGAYVNEHGIIHQTTTLRNVRESSLWYEHMRPETKDSWFPGYAWTIAYCSFCHSHLGWKFTRVQSSRSLLTANDNADRPLLFWGLSGASVTTTARRNPISNQESEGVEG